MTDLLGWCCSIVLLGTIVAQITRQWREGSSEGVSPFLFVGQGVASVGFTVYSALLENWVFTFTNAAMAVSAVVGMLVRAHFKRHPREKGDAPGMPA
jgi:MtN3 and saliva related transmembrane protein